MKVLVSFVGLCLLAALPAWSQNQPQTSKRRAVLELYDRVLALEEKFQKRETHSQELQKEIDTFLESDSALNHLAGVAMFVGALKAWIPDIKANLAEEDSLITNLVASSTGLAGDAKAYADEGVRLLREKHVYATQEFGLAQEITNDLTRLLRGIREDRLAELPELLDEQQFAQKLKAMDDLGRKEGLAFAQAKDAFTRLKAASK